MDILVNIFELSRSYLFGTQRLRTSHLAPRTSHLAPRASLFQGVFTRTLQMTITIRSLIFLPDALRTEDTQPVIGLRS